MNLISLSFQGCGPNFSPPTLCADVERSRGRRGGPDPLLNPHSKITENRPRTLWRTQLFPGTPPPLEKFSIDPGIVSPLDQRMSCENDRLNSLIFVSAYKVGNGLYGVLSE